ncbi:MAG: hypothetical protein ACRCR9_00745 [Chitinophagaceae bacterium]
MSTNKQKTWIITLAILAIVLLGTTLYTCNSVKTLTIQLDDTTNAKRLLDSQVVVMDLQINQLSQDTSKLSQELRDRLREIKNLRSQLAKALKDKKIAIAKALVLQKQVDQLMLKIQDLEAEIARLQAENKVLRDSNTLLVFQKEVVTKTKDSILIVSSKLNVANIVFTPLGKIWFLGKSRIVEKAKQVKIVSISFDLEDNPFAPSGLKQLYISILKPNGSVASAQKDKIQDTTNNKELEYTFKSEANFTQGQPTKGITYKWDLDLLKEKLEPGTYFIKVYDPVGYLMGENSYRLQ